MTRDAKRSAHSVGLPAVASKVANRNDGALLRSAAGRGPKLATSTGHDLAQAALTPPSLPIPARRIGDHRKAYLDYEGSLSRNRGDVRRVDEGSIEFEESTDDGFVFCLRGSRLAGRFSLTLEGDTWMLNRVG